MNWYATSYPDVRTTVHDDFCKYVGEVTPSVSKDYGKDLTAALEVFIYRLEHCPRCGCHISGHHPVGCEGAGGNCGCFYTREQVQDLIAATGGVLPTCLCDPEWEGTCPIHGWGTPFNAPFEARTVPNPEHNALDSAEPQEDDSPF
jgi:hypothetical protein